MGSQSLGRGVAEQQRARDNVEYGDATFGPGGSASARGKVLLLLPRPLFLKGGTRRTRSGRCF